MGRMTRKIVLEQLFSIVTTVDFGHGDQGSSVLG